MIATTTKPMINSLDKIFSAMRNGKYGSVTDTKGKLYAGLINAITREDGSGKNWIVTISFGLDTEKVFIYAK